MRSTFHGLEIGKRALYAQQSALSTTAHNIANANTEGYTRQRAVMQAANPIPYPGMTNDRAPGQIGTGVEVIMLQRIREGFLDLQFRSENVRLGYWEAKSDTLSKLEAIFNEPSDTGLQNTLDRFWQAWEDLASQPESMDARDVVRQRGIAVAETFRHIAQSLNRLQEDLDHEIQVKVDEINSLVRQIAALNDEIARLVPHGYQPNDLYDQRDLLLDKLSHLVDIKVESASNGMVNVFIRHDAGGGTVDQPLILGTVYEQLNIQKVVDPTTGVDTVEIYITDSSAPPPGVQLNLTSGKLFGLLESYNTDIPAFRQRLDQLAANFANEVNKIHENGWNLEDIQNGSKGAPISFFVAKDSTKPLSAENLTINSVLLDPDIHQSLTKIAAAAAPANPGDKAYAGDGKNALEIAKLKFTTTLDDDYRSIISSLGIQSQEAQRMLKNSEALVGQVEQRRQSVSSVSLDEEMTNMIKFQHAYNAAARMITAVDEVLNKVINGMGRVGL